ERERQFRDAARCYHEAKDARREAAALSRAGDFFAAGIACLEVGLDIEALAELRQVAKGSPDFESARAKIAAIEARRARPAKKPPSERAPAAPPASAPKAAPQWIGRVVDRYRVTDVLGAGAFADVFAAEHVHLERKVALKVLKSRFATRPSVAEGFVREAKLVSRLRHPGIAEVYDFGPVDGTFFMALELVSGRTLRATIKERAPLPLARAARTVRAILEAVHAAHKAGVVHRDLKPENVLEDGAGGVRVVDFGMAKVFWGVKGEDGVQFAGTPPYASPEAARGEAVDAR